MKTDKEYPATHSMWTSWFAVDLDGNVAIMECADNGPAPLGARIQVDSDELVLESLIGSSSKRINYRKEQLERIMTNAMPSVQYLPTFEYFQGIWGVLCEIDASKLESLEEAVKLNMKNELICVSKELNLWYVDFHLPHIYDKNGDKLYKLSKKKLEEKEYAKSLYRRIIDENVIKRILELSWPLGYDYDETTVGIIRHEDSPFDMYFQDYDAHMPFERMLLQNKGKCVSFDQLPQDIKEKALRLPLRFEDAEKIQLGEFVASSYHGSCADNWIVDGQTANVVRFPDGSFKFVGNNCWFKPIDMDEAFATHEVYLKDEYHQEYKINGKRGYIKAEWRDDFWLTGTSEFYKPSPDDIIEAVNVSDE